MKMPIMAGTAALLLAACTDGLSPSVDPMRHGLQSPPDTCGAHLHASLIGQSIDRVPTSGRTIRIASDVDPITEEYRPGRINIFYEKEKRTIIGIRCF